MTIVNSAELAVRPKTSKLGWVALGLSIVGFIMAVVPGPSVFAWILLLPAFIVSIVALAKKNTAKAVPVVSLILTVVSGIIAIIVSVVAAVAVVAGAASTATEDSGVTVEEATGGIGQVVTTDDGVDFTVDAITCALTSYTSYFETEETPLGQFCEVKFTIANSGDREAIVFPNYVGGLIGSTEFAASGTLSTFTDGSGSVELNPGLSISGSAVLDIPLDQSLDAITFTDGFLSEDIAVSAK